MATKSTAKLEYFVEPGAPATVNAPAGMDISAANRWLESSTEALRDALDTEGALYIRGLPVQTPADLAVLRDTLIAKRAAYREKATPRSDFGDDIFSSTDLPPSQPIRMHNENSYTLTFPGLLIFACLIPPARNGATPVADCRRVLRALPDDMVESFRKSGWALTRNYATHVSLDWSTAFGTRDKSEVERYCVDNQIAYEWRDDGHLRTTQRRSAIIRHPSTDAEVWFNHVAFWNEWSLDEEVREVLVDELGHDNLPFNTTFGNGQPLEPNQVTTLNAAYEKVTVRRQWQAGDILLVDNILTAHGRDPFQGQRQIVVAMGEPVNVADCHPTVPAMAGLDQ